MTTLQSQDTENACIIAGAILLLLDVNEGKRRPRSTWVSPWLKKRNEQGVCENLLRELSVGDQMEQRLFSSFHRMDKASFDHLLSLVCPMIKKQDTNMRLAIRPEARLALTLHFLATGNSFRSLQYLFRIPQCTISKIIPEVLDAIYTALSPCYLKVPESTERWAEIEEKFKNVWHFPNCLGAIDGKHVSMIAPPNAGSVYYNYKGSHSIVLMAVCDAEYKFIYVDVGRNGRSSDGGVFNACTFANALYNDKLNLPPPKPLPGRSIEVPHVFVADDAFALTTHIMKPYSMRNLLPPKRIHNYRLSRARRTIENTFGIMSATFRVLRSPIHLDAVKTRKVTLACCALHNFLMVRKGSSNLGDRVNNNGDIIAGEWRREPASNNLLSLEANRGNISQNAKQIRQEFEEYFVNEGATPWQWDHIK